MAVKKSGKLPRIKQSAHEIWLAGLGAFALAGAEGGKLFRSLVKHGAGLEKVNKTRIQKLASRAGDLRDEARTAVARVKNPIEAGMNSAISRLGIPSRKEIATLTKRVEELTRVVAKARGTKGKARKRSSRSVATIA